jgi:acyl-phosphate glycerol 3-phosphate acyltransferase
MAALLVVAATFLAAYLVGAVPFGFLVARWRGVDIFRQGSGNIGATNVGRVLGRRFGIIVFFLDFAKGALPVTAALRVAQLPGLGLGEALPPQALGVVGGLGAFLGHLFPVYLRFRGGKGVATGAGVIAVLMPGPALGAFLTWVAVVCATRYVSLASLAAAAALCAFQLLTPRPFTPPGLIMTLFSGLAAALVFLRHRANLARLLRGTENRLQDTPAMLTLTKTLHVLALGLWFGTVVFFTFVVALTLFETFESLGARRADRPAWFPLPDTFAKPGPPLDGPKEQGTRAAGYVIGPLFDRYYLIQGVCGLLAVATAAAWLRSPPGRRVEKVRLAVLVAALVTVGVGWLLDLKVNELRGPRNEAVDKFLQGASTGPGEAKTASLDAKAEFGLWHTVSVFVNLGTVLLVGVGMALAARLPEGEPRREAGDKPWPGDARA